MTAPPGPLPRSLAPLPEESLAGFLLRLGHRLRRSPGRVAELCGLVSDERERLPTVFLQYLTPEQAGRLAAAARLSRAEAHALTLGHLADGYPPLAAVRANPQRTQIMASSHWALNFSPRYCPDCLAGDGSTIQTAHGGPWKRTWHLPVVFACRRHQRLLHHQCPTCHQPLNSYTRARLNLVKGPFRAVTHPVHCRNPAPPTSTDTEGALCATRLDRVRPHRPEASGSTLEHLLALQHRLLAPLTPGAEPVGPHRFSDLVMAAQLVKLSWPLGAGLLPTTALADLTDAHAADAARLLRASGSGARRTGFRSPPADPAQCGALLLAADTLLDAPSSTALRERIQPLVKETNARARMYSAAIARSLDISPRMARAMAARTYGSQGHRNLHARTRRYTPDHVPAYLPLAWYRTYFDGFTDRLPPGARRADRERALRQAAALRLAQLATGHSWTTCAAALGSTKSTAAKVLNRLGRELQEAGQWPDFERRVERIADFLDADPQRTDYGHRRRTLSTWAMPDHHWRALTGGIPRLRRLNEQADAAVGTALTWCEATQGHYLHSPTVRARQRGAARARLTDDIRPLVTGDLRRDRLLLHRRIRAYAGQLARTCDRSRPPPFSITIGAGHAGQQEQE